MARRKLSLPPLRSDITDPNLLAMSVQVLESLRDDPDVDPETRIRATQRILDHWKVMKAYSMHREGSDSSDAGDVTANKPDVFRGLRLRVS